MNSIEVSAYVARDPVVSSNSNGTVFAIMTLPDNRRYKNREGDMDEETTWFDVIAYGNLALIIERYVRKGRFVSVYGEVRGVRRYVPEGQDEREFESVRVKANRVHFGPQDRGGRPARRRQNRGVHPQLQRRGPALVGLQSRSRRGRAAAANNGGN